MEQNTKLAINLNEGTVQVEGPEAFVRSVYEDFKDMFAKRRASGPAILTVNAQPTSSPAQITDETTKLKRRVGRKSARPDTDGPRSADYKPKFRGDLDLKDLEAAYDAFKPKFHSEKMLLFAMFLREHFKIAPCTADDIFTCYETMKKKTATPEAFVQAFRDVDKRSHFIEFHSPQKIEITIAGSNFYQKKLKEMNEAAK
jgi:hypothetical protein